MAFRNKKKRCGYLEHIDEPRFATTELFSIAEEFEDAHADAKARFIQPAGHIALVFRSMDRLETLEIPSLEISDVLHAALKVLHHFGKEEGKGTQTDLSRAKSDRRSVQNTVKHTETERRERGAYFTLAATQWAIEDVQFGRRHAGTATRFHADRGNAQWHSSEGTNGALMR